MANPEQVEIVKHGATTMLRWRHKNLNVPLDRTGADLGEAQSVD